MNSTIERIRSEQDLHNLRVAGAAQSSDGYKKVWDSLSNQVGVTIEMDKAWAALNAKKDEKGIAMLKKLSQKR